MNNQIDNLKELWQNSRRNDFCKPDDKDQIIRIANQKMKSTISLQIGTIVVLTTTLVIICLYFFYVANFKQTMSLIGESLMIVGLVIRIMIELVSIYLSRQINMGETTLKANYVSLTYYQFRKRVNGPVTIAIIIMYTIGFYMLTPEFKTYFSKPMMLFIDGSYIIIAAILIWFVGKKVRKEMNILNTILQIQKDIQKREE